MLSKLNRYNFFLLFCFIANVSALPAFSANPSVPDKSSGISTTDEQVFIFAGKCPNGNVYRIVSYQLDVDGLTKSFYDYEGPAGKGTVQTEIQPRKMVVRICHELADLRDGSKFD